MMDDLLFITGVTTEGLQFISKNIDIHKDQTLLYFNHYCTEELMFERNWDEVFDDLNKNLEYFGSCMATTKMKIFGMI